MLTRAGGRVCVMRTDFGSREHGTWNCSRPSWYRVVMERVIDQATLPRFDGEIDNTTDDPRGRPPLILGGKTFATVTESVANVAERRTTLGWKIAFAVSLSFLGLLVLCLGYLITTGVGVWG